MVLKHYIKNSNTASQSSKHFTNAPVEVIK